MLRVKAITVANYRVFFLFLKSLSASFLILNYVDMCMLMYMYVGGVASEAKGRHRGPPELESQAVVSGLVFLGKALQALYCRGFPSAPQLSHLARCCFVFCGFRLKWPPYVTEYDLGLSILLPPSPEA